MTRILIVEDEESYREPLVYQLTREGYDVSAAATGEEGLELFTKGGIDLVLLDLMLQGLTAPRYVAEFVSKAVYRSSCSPRKARKSTRWSVWKSARTTTSPSRTRSASCWRGCVRCCDATRWWPTRRNPPMTIFR